ncbi:MAG TPA: SRPBCC domain-containing protein [Terriglobales bacterium]|nr:SRPBCC domain-containing protein [Terriglobales bacterium]
MATATVGKDQDTVVSEIEISAPPERVFQALIDSKQLMQWWNSEQCRSKSWQIEPRKGGRWHYETEPSGLVVNGVSEFKVGGEILEYDPPRLLAYSWIANWHDDPNATTVVRWELNKAGPRTRVKVTHSGLTNLPVSRKDYSGGWPGVVDSLKKFVES